MNLNLGCGNKAKEGYIGVDAYPCKAANLISNLERTLPFRDSSINKIYLDNVIEHINDIPSFMKELHRVCKNKSEIELITPHFASLSSWKDPTHVQHLSYFSFDHFAKESVKHYIGGGFMVQKRRISFGGFMGNIGRIIYLISPKAYETSWCFIFRPGTIYITLSVEKYIHSK